MSLLYYYWLTNVGNVQFSALAKNSSACGPRIKLSTSWFSDNPLTEPPHFSLLTSHKHILDSYLLPTMQQTYRTSQVHVLSQWTEVSHPEDNEVIWIWGYARALSTPLLWHCGWSVLHLKPLPDTHNSCITATADNRKGWEYRITGF